MFNILGLSRKQICSLWTRFYELDCDVHNDTKGHKGYLDAEDLKRVPKFGANPIALRLTKVIFDDFGSNGKLTFSQFVDFMSTFAQRERGHHYQRRRSSVLTATSATQTDLETIRYCPADTARTRKIKFIFRVRLIVDFSFFDLLVVFRCMILIMMDVYQKKMYKKS
jgi:hypothetical protein